MDTSPEYIKMCEKAKEIQKHKPVQLDFYVKKSGAPWPSIWVYPLDFVSWQSIKPEGDGLVAREERPINCYSKADFIWLPRQDQLQAMAIEKQIKYHYNHPIKSKLYFVLKDFYIFAGKTWNDTHPFGKCVEKEGGGYEVKASHQYLLGSYEQLWLAFVMSERYNKKWNGENWK